MRVEHSKEYSLKYTINQKYMPQGKRWHMSVIGRDFRAKRQRHGRLHACHSVNVPAGPLSQTCINGPFFFLRPSSESLSISGTSWCRCACTLSVIHSAKCQCRDKYVHESSSSILDTWGHRTELRLRFLEFQTKRQNQNNFFGNTCESVFKCLSVAHFYFQNESHESIYGVEFQYWFPIEWFLILVLSYKNPISHDYKSAL